MPTLCALSDLAILPTLTLLTPPCSAAPCPPPYSPPLSPPLPARLFAHTGDSLVLVADDDSCIGPNMPALEAAAAKLDGQAMSPAGSYTMRRASPRPSSFGLHDNDSMDPQESHRSQLLSPGARQIVRGTMDLVKHQVRVIARGRKSEGGSQGEVPGLARTSLFRSQQ